MSCRDSYLTRDIPISGDIIERRNVTNDPLLWTKIPIDSCPLDGKPYAINSDTTKPLHPSVASHILENFTDLFSWLGYKHWNNVILTPSAARDIAFWQEIVALIVPHQHCEEPAPYPSTQRRRTSKYEWTDASSAVRSDGTRLILHHGYHQSHALPSWFLGVMQTK